MLSNALRKSSSVIARVQSFRVPSATSVKTSTHTTDPSSVEADVELKRSHRSDTTHETLKRPRLLQIFCHVLIGNLDTLSVISRASSAYSATLSSIAGISIKRWAHFRRLRAVRKETFRMNSGWAFCAKA
jgi:hypothetical protein